MRGNYEVALLYNWGMDEILGPQHKPIGCPVGFVLGHDLEDLYHSNYHGHRYRQRFTFFGTLRLSLGVLEEGVGLCLGSIDRRHLLRAAWSATKGPPTRRRDIQLLGRRTATARARGRRLSPSSPGWKGRHW